MLRLLSALALAGLASSCISAATERGIEPRWLDADVRFETGVSTRAEVLERLGPPSQVVAIEGGTILYYLLERTTEKGLVLLIYNTNTERTRYERAVYFFDEDGVLTDQAVGTDAEEE